MHALRLRYGRSRQRGQVEPARNAIEVDVTPAWRNALRARAENGDDILARFRSKPRVSAGLLGPARIRVERPAEGG